MADETIREQLVFDGDSRGAEAAGKRASGSMQDVEQQAGRSSSKIRQYGGAIGSLFSGMASGLAKAATVAASAGTLAAKGAGVAASAVGGVLTGALLKASGAASAVASGIGAIAGEALRLAGTTKEADALGKTWEKTKNLLLSPVVHFLDDAFKELNATLQDPSVQLFIRQLTALITVALRPAGAAVKDLLAGFRAFARALSQGDVLGALKALGDGIGTALDRLTGGMFSNGVKLVQELAQGIIEGGKQLLTNALNFIGQLISSFLEGHSPPPRGPLSTIDKWGIKLLNTFLSGFRKADFSVLDDVAGIIKEHLQASVDSGQMKQEGLIPRLVGSQSAVAEALAAMRQTGGLTDQILQRLHSRLADLGGPVNDYVEAELRALDATRAVAAAQDQVNAASARLKAAQAEDTQRLSDAEAEVNRLQAEQADRLAKLAPLREAVADAAEDQYQAELRVWAAQDALIPLQEWLASAQANLAAFQEAALQRQKELTDILTAAQKELEAAQKAAAVREKELANAVAFAQTALNAVQQAAQEHQQAWQDKIAAAQAETDAALQREQGLLDGVERRYNGQIAAQQKILDAIDKKWATELKGAQDAFDASNKLYEAEQRRNDTQTLAFERQRAAVQSIYDPNKRIAALAAIDRAEKQYQERNKDRLSAAQLQAKLDEDRLKGVQGQIAGEKLSPQAEIERLQGLLQAEEKAIQDRMAAIRAEGEQRVKDLQRQADAQKKIDDAAVKAAQDRVEAAQADLALQQATDEAMLAAAQARVDLDQQALNAEKAADDTIAATLQARVDTAQAEVDAQQKLVDAAERQVELAGRRQQIAQHELDLAEQRIHEETDADITSAETRLDSIRKENEAREAGLQAQVEAAQAALDNAQKVVDAYQAAADLAKARIDYEAQIAALIKAQNDLLDQQNAKGGAGGTGGTGKPFIPGALSDAEIDGLLAPWRAAFDTFKLDLQGKWGELIANIRKITDPLGTLFTDIFHGDFAGAKIELDKLGGVIGDWIKTTFGDQALATVRKFTDPAGDLLKTVLSIAQDIADGKPILDAVGDEFAGWIERNFGAEALAKVQQWTNPIGRTVPLIAGIWQDIASGKDVLDSVGNNFRLWIFENFGNDALLQVRAWTDPIGSGFRLIETIFDDIDSGSLTIDRVGAYFADWIKKNFGDEALNSVKQWSDPLGNIAKVLDILATTNAKISDPNQLGSLIVSITSAIGTDADVKTAQDFAAFLERLGQIFDILDKKRDISSAEGLLGLIKDLVRAVGTDEDLKNLNTFATNIQAVGQALSELGDAINKGDLPGALDKLAKAWQALVDTVTGKAQGSGGTLDNGTHSASGSFRQMATEVVGQDGKSGTLGQMSKDVHGSFQKIHDDLVGQSGQAGIAGQTRTDVKGVWQQTNNDIVGADKQSGIIGTIGNAIGSMFRTVGSALVGNDQKSGIIGTIGNAIGSMFRTVGSALVGDDQKSGIIGGFLSGVGSLFVSARDTVVGSDGTKGVLGTVLTGVGNLLLGTSTALITNAPTILGDWLAIFGSADKEQSLAWHFRNFMQGVGEAWGNLFGGIGVKDSLIARWSPFAVDFLALWLALFGPKDQEGTLMWFLFSKDGFFNTLDNETRTKLDFHRIEVWQASFQELKNQIVGDRTGHGGILNSLKEDALSKATEVGENVGQGIADGINNKLKTIEDAARAAVKAAIDAANNEAKNASPSKRTTLTGISMGAGLIVGMGKMLNGIANMGRMMSRAALGGIGSPALAFAVPAVAAAGAYGSNYSVAPAGAGSISTTNTASHQVTNVGVVHNHFTSVDGLPEQERRGYFS